MIEGINDMKKCKKCLISDSFPNITIDESGICNLCKSENFGGDKEEKEKFKKDFEEYINKIKGKSKYDCILLYSGGKDSTYLLYVLKEIYKLNVLTVTINTGNEPAKMQENINKCLSKLSVDHIMVSPERDFYKKLFSYYLTSNNNKTNCNMICRICQRLMQSIALNIAVEKNIPFVAIGYSPDQAKRYEFSKEIMTSNWMPDDLNHYPFTDKDRSLFWNPEKLNQKDIPRFLIPFYAIDYPGVEKIIDILAGIGIGNKRNLNPLKSNCNLSWLLMYLDMKKYGYNPYLESAHRQIRQGTAVSKKWKILLHFGNWLLKHRLIKRKEMDKALRFVDISIEQCLN